MSLNSFSQIDTSKTSLPNKILKQVAKDLIKYDGCKEEVKLLNDKIVKLGERESKKDTLINLLSDKDKNNQFIIGKKDEQLTISKELSDKLEKELKTQRTKTFLWKFGTYVGIIASTFLLISK